MRVMLASLLFLLVGFAGCADTAPTTDLDHDDGSSGNETALPAVVNNTAPAAVLVVEGFEALNGTINVTAPATLNFTLNGTDIDGDNLTWTFAVNGTETFNGTELPALANHTFEAAGLFNVTFTVSDGLNSTITQLVLNVTVAVVPEPTLLAEFSNSGLIGGAYALKGDADYAHTCPGFNAGQSGYGCVFVEYDEAYYGMPAIITTDAANLRLAFWDACGPTGTGQGWAEGTSGLAISLPAAGCMVAWSSSIGDWGTERSFTIQVFDFLAE